MLVYQRVHENGSVPSPLRGGKSAAAPPECCRLPETLSRWPLGAEDNATWRRPGRWGVAFGRGTKKRTKQFMWWYVYKHNNICIRYGLQYIYIIIINYIYIYIDESTVHDWNKIDHSWPMSWHHLQWWSKLTPGCKAREQPIIGSVSKPIVPL